MNIQTPSKERGYIPIADHGLVGNLRTAALVSLDGSVESYCVPNFDSPSIFARILDQNKGGHFSITPVVPFTTKQNYLPSSNVLQTKFMNDDGVVSVIDYLPRPSPATIKTKPLLPWLIRHVEVIRGSVSLEMECAPAFNYARDPHKMQIIRDETITPSEEESQRAVFDSAQLSLDLRYVCESKGDDTTPPNVSLIPLDLSKNGHLGMAVKANLDLTEGQVVTFILRHNPAAESGDPSLDATLLDILFKGTMNYWTTWIRRSKYKGSWKEAVHRSALALKLLIYEPTGAVVASPTFSLPEFIGGGRNWDYRFSWIRDSSFTLYALIRLGFTEEADAYMSFIFGRLRDKNEDGSIQIMYSIHGGKELEEFELNHLEGHKNSRPVRIGNGAANHLQLDIYGELMDCIYLGQKFGKPLAYDDWVLVRDLVDYVVRTYDRPDLSIWEVRGEQKNFTYSKIMLWVAIDRGIRIAEKRSLPCPHRNQWLEARDKLYEEVMEKAWNGKAFGQSYEDNNVLDSSVLVMPLVLFMQGSDPRFENTLKEILKGRDRGGLCSNGLIYRYDTKKVDDGVGGEEGTFSLCTLWCIESMTYAGRYDPTMLRKAIKMFEDFLLFLNHLGLCTEEVSGSGELLGNAVQAFTHVTLISSAFNLSRTMEGYRGL